MKKISQNHSDADYRRRANAIQREKLMNCRVCAGIADRSYLLHSHRNDLDVQTFYCPVCDAFFSAGGPVNYGDIGDIDIIAYYLEYEQEIRNRYRSVFSFIETLVTSGRFLDIGAGIGFSLEVARQYGWVSAGLEPNAELVCHARERGLDISNAYLSGETSGEYDFILIDNVLEHILQP